MLNLTENIFFGSSEENQFLKQFESKIKEAWYVTDYKGDTYKFFRTVTTTYSVSRSYLFRKSLAQQNGTFETTIDSWDNTIDVLYRLRVKRKKVGVLTFGHSTIKFFPKNHCEKVCDYAGCEKYQKLPDSCFQTCEKFATNASGSNDSQKENKRILSRWKIKQEDLTGEMTVTVPRERIIYETQGYVMSRVTKTKNGSG